MLLASTHFKPVIGVDFHTLILPPSPIPVPIPHIGLVIDPFDYIPHIGGTVKINHVHKGNGFTMGKIVTFIHFPKTALPNVGSDSYSFFSSLTVKANHGSLAPTGFLCMSCNDLGIPLSFTPEKATFKPVPSLYLPTSIILPIPFGKPVRVGGPYPPDLMAWAMNLAISFGFCYIFKWLSKINLKALLNKAMNNSKIIDKLTKALEKKLGKCLHDPVDLILGRVFYEYTDFEIAGIIPIQWKRIWHSDSQYEGSLGFGQHHNYDIHLHIEEETQAIWAVLPDGRPTFFPLLKKNEESYYNTAEKLFLTYKDGKYILQDYQRNLFYSFAKYDNSNKCLLQKIYNVTNATVKFEYDYGGKLTTIIDTAGRKINLTLNKNGLIVNIDVTHQGHTKQLIAYNYNENNDLIQIIDPLKQATTIVYENHLMVKKTDRNGQSFYWQYDGTASGAKCIKTWGDGGLLFGKIEYKKGFNIDINSLGEKNIFYYNQQNLCTQITNAEGYDKYFEYTPEGQLLREIDEEGNLTGYTYNKFGFVSKILQPNGAEIQRLYNEDGKLVLLIDAEGNKTVYTYYDNGQLNAVIAPNNNITSYKYNQLGLISTVINADEKEIQLEYDTDNNLAKVTLPNGNTAKWIYDNWGRCLTAINPLGTINSYTYDELDRVINTSSPDGTAIKLKYNAYDEVIEAVNNTHAVEFEYTPMGLLKQRKQDGKKINFNYDTEQQLTALVNEKGERYSFKRNKNGSIIQETGFDGLQRQYQRTPADKVRRTQRPNNKWTEYEYNNIGQITRAEYSDGTWETFTYNANGQLVQAHNQQNTLHIQRDELGRVIKEKQGEHWVQSGYHQYYGRQAIQSSLGANIAIDYNQQGQVSTMAANNWQANMQYNSIGQEVERVLTGNVCNTWLYDNVGRPIEQRTLSGKYVNRHKAYNWAANNKLQSITDKLTGENIQYSYDAFDNLVSAFTTPQHDYKAYFRDDVGNIFNKENKQDRKYGAGGRLEQMDGTQYQYDAEGFLIKKIEQGGHTWQYAYTGNGMMQSITRPDSSKIEFEYDALGRRTAKIFDGTITRFIWDGNVPLHEWSYNIANRPKAVVDEYGILTYDKEEPTENLVTWVFDQGSFKPAAKLINGETFTIINDYLGTPTQAFDSSGNKVWERELYSYGKVKKETGEKNFIPFLYQGQYKDVETGLCYNRFRYYFIHEGMYVGQQDPIGLSAGKLNLYSYVDEPNAWIDALGLDGILGAFGEKVASKFLSGQGHSILGSVQNASGHGFDLVTKTKDGFINIIEVKTSQGNWRSKSNMPKWTNDNITKIIGNSNGHWADMPDYQKNLMDIIEEANQKGKLKNKLLQINVDKRGIRLKCK